MGDCFCWQEHCPLGTQEEMGHLSYLKGWSWEIWSSWKDTSLGHQKNLQILVPPTAKAMGHWGYLGKESCLWSRSVGLGLWEVWEGTWWKGTGEGGHCFQAAEEWAGNTSPGMHAHKLSKQGENIQPWHIPFPTLNQSIVPCPVLTVASLPAYRFLRRQVRWSAFPISLRIFHSLSWSTESKALV